MLRRNHEFVYQLFALLVAVIVVHGVYVGIIRPGADAHLATELALQASGEAFVSQRSLYIILKDYEQEACIILSLWALAIMAYKIRHNLAERKLLGSSLLNVSDGTRILPEDARALLRPIQALPEEQQSFLLPRVLTAALQRFGATGDIADASAAIKDLCDTENERLDSELSMVRYIAWAIPAIGFIGTVRGMGDALSQAHRAVEGDIVGVTASLGVAFNSTFVALVVSIVMMFFMHQLQLAQERLVLDTQNYGDRNLIRHLKGGKDAT